MNIEIVKITNNGVARLKEIIGKTRLYVLHDEYEPDEIDSVHITNFNSTNKKARPTLIVSKDDYVFVDSANDVFSMSPEEVLKLLFSNKNNSINVNLYDDNEIKEVIKHQCPNCGKEAKDELSFSTIGVRYPLCKECGLAFINKKWVKACEFPGNKTSLKCPVCNTEPVKDCFTHNGRRLDACPKCNKVFFPEENRWFDALDAVKKCSDNVLENKQDTELKDLNTPIYRCSCGETIKYNTDDENITCPKCNKTISNPRFRYYIKNKCPNCGIDATIGGFKGSNRKYDMCPECNRVFDDTNNKWIDNNEAVSKFIDTKDTESFCVATAVNAKSDIKKDKCAYTCLECGSHNVSERKIVDSDVRVCTSCGKAHEVGKNGELIDIKDFSEYCIKKYKQQKERIIDRGVRRKGKCLCGNDRFHKHDGVYICTNCNNTIAEFVDGIYSFSDISASNKHFRNSVITDFEYSNSQAQHAKELVDDLLKLSNRNFIDMDTYLCMSIIINSIRTLYGLEG